MPQRRIDEKTIQQGTKEFFLLEAQRKPANALFGELGLFRNEDGSVSSERSGTAEVDGRFINFPLLVRGQSDEAIGRILDEKPSREDFNFAVKRAMERRREGLDLPTFGTQDEAEKAARARSRSLGRR